MMCERLNELDLTHMLSAVIALNITCWRNQTNLEAGLNLRNPFMPAVLERNKTNQEENG
jgi:hypothetical protein